MLVSLLTLTTEFVFTRLLTTSSARWPFSVWSNTVIIASVENNVVVCEQYENMLCLKCTVQNLPHLQMWFSYSRCCIVAHKYDSWLCWEGCFSHAVWTGLRGTANLVGVCPNNLYVQKTSDTERAHSLMLEHLSVWLSFNQICVYLCVVTAHFWALVLTVIVILDLIHP